MGTEGIKDTYEEEKWMDLVIDCILLNRENTEFRMTVSFLDEESLNDKAPFTKKKKKIQEKEQFGNT